MNTTPKLSFIYAYPLDASRRRLFEVKGLGYYPSRKEIQESMHYIEGLWEKVNVNDRIIKMLMGYTNSTPERELICYVFGKGMNPMSTPFLLPTHQEFGGKLMTGEQYITTLIHEIAHLFVSSNVSVRKFIRNKYNEESILTQNHILIFALLDTMLSQIYTREKAEELLIFSTIHPDYARALELSRMASPEVLIKKMQGGK